VVGEAGAQAIHDDALGVEVGLRDHVARVALALGGHRRAPALHQPQTGLPGELQGDVDHGGAPRRRIARIVTRRIGRRAAGCRRSGAKPAA
jgi:hypothetical protein